MAPRMLFTLQRAEFPQDILVHEANMLKHEQHTVCRKGKGFSFQAFAILREKSRVIIQE